MDIYSFSIRAKKVIGTDLDKYGIELASFGVEMFVDLYSYKPCIELLYVNNQLCCGKVNYPMERRELIKLHRGVDNQVYFTVRNRDYKKVSLSHLSVKGKIINKQNGALLLERYLEQGTCTGELKLNVFEGDLKDIAPGFYEMVLQGEEAVLDTTPDLIAATPFYSNQNSDVRIEVEVTNQGNAVPVDSTELLPENWIPLNAAELPYITISPAVSCNAIRNHLNSLHTFVVYATNFSGYIELLGSLDLNPPTDINQYFKVEITPGSNRIEFDEFTGIDAFTIQSNLVWVKFRLVYDADLTLDQNGTIDKILWRS